MKCPHVVKMDIFNSCFKIVGAAPRRYCICRMKKTPYIAQSKTIIYSYLLTAKELEIEEADHVRS